MFTLYNKMFAIAPEPDQDQIIDDHGQILYKCCTLVLGTILNHSKSVILIRENWRKIELKRCDNKHKCILYFDRDVVEYEFCLLYDARLLKDILNTKVFNYAIYITNLEMNMVLYVNSATIELRTSSQERHVIRSLMSQAFEIKDQSMDDEPVLSVRDINLNELFDKVISTRELRNSAQVESDSSDDYARRLQLRIRLKKKLYPYQEKAVLWMVKRELPKYYTKSALHPPNLYERVVLSGGVSMFYNPFRNHLKFQPEPIPALSSGGLLCDEMGLGKTVEVLGCVLLHRRPERKRLTASYSKKRRRILDSDSSSSDEDEDNLVEDEDIPLNLRAKALRSRPVMEWAVKAHVPKRKNEVSVDNPNLLMNPSRYIPRFFIRPQPSTTRQLLQTWYDKKLSSFNASNKNVATDKQRDMEISCVCGISMDDAVVSSKLVECAECRIHQHASCFGYNKAKRQKAGLEYLCAACWKQKPLLKSGATLIVCPSRLLSQWQDEIRKHVRGELRVFIYKGGSRSHPVYPTDLQRYDIVLTTYHVLHHDLLIVESNSKTLRQKSRYCPPSASIANVNWWRLVLDEAQLVESPMLSVSKMAKLLSAKHRWAITGTPITKGLEDLLGIVDYLSMEPYMNKDVWYFKLMRPYLTNVEAPMLNFLAEIMWRTEKRDIKDQISIPKQTFEVIWLDFSQIESYFYAREYEASKSLFIQKLDALNMPDQTPIHNLPVRALANILAPVLTLRHTCSHFSAVKGRYLVSRKPLNSLQDLLDALVQKNSVDFEDNLRIAVSAWNGIAGIHLLLNNTALALLQYKRVLGVQKTLRQPISGMDVRMDNLQIIHALYNLISILEECPELHTNSSEVDQLKEDHLRHEKVYIDKFDVEVLKAKKCFDKAETAISNMAEEYNLDEIWDVYSTVEWIMKNNKYNKFVGMMENHALMTDDRRLHKLNIGQHLELLAMLDHWETKLMNVRDVCVTAVIDLAIYRYDGADGMSVHIEDSIVESAVQCHLRISSERAVKSGDRQMCKVCSVDRQLNDYETLLYNKHWKPSPSSSSTTVWRGNWAPSFEEIALQCIAVLGAKQSNNADAERKGQAQKLLLNCMRNELKAARALWMKVSFAVNGRDELNNCRIRLDLNPGADSDVVGNVSQCHPIRNNILRNLRYEDDDRLERIHLLNRSELDYQHVHLNNEAEMAVKEYERLLGTNLYLSTLRGKDVREGGGGRTLDPCPICHNELDNTFHMMPCGHCYCVNCMHVLAQDAVQNAVPCAVCRLRHHLKDINYLKIKPDSCADEKDEAREIIKGNCSTKLESVIRLVLRLRKNEPDLKLLIYSIWNSVLNILLQALHDNGVTAVHMINEKHLDQFKDPANKITALLLRISNGSKGLTLIEATHVIFLDPVIDPSDELQAISRVHRIGQTRATVVHRFLMRDSIDESIYNITNSAGKSIRWKELTIAQLKGLYTHNSEV